MEWNKIFNNKRILALFLMIIAGILGWWSLILLTNPCNEKVKATKVQIWGLFFTILISLLIWVKKCFTVKPYHVKK
jgi:cytochrome bd-type quinol oxidase subunit 1